MKYVKCAFQYTVYFTGCALEMFGALIALAGMFLRDLSGKNKF